MSMNSFSRLFFSISFCLLSSQVFSKPIDITSLNRQAQPCRGEDQSRCESHLRRKIQEQQGRSFNIVVVPLSSEFGMQSGDIATNLLKRELVVGGVNVLDRKIQQEIKQELKAIAAGGGTGKRISFSYADFAIKGEVLNLVTDKVFKVAENDCSVLGNDCPMRCEVNFATTVRISVFNTQPLQKVTDFTISGKNVNTYNNVTEESCKIKDIARDLRGGFQKTFSDNAGFITGSFSQDGYVTALASSGKKYYVRTHLNKSDKYPKGTQAEIILTSKIKDPLLGEITQVKTLAKGKVVETKGDDYLWIELKRKYDPENVLIGDVIKINTKVKKCGPLDMKCKALQASELVKQQISMP